MNLTSENQFISETNGYSLSIKREDLLHPTVSGNKFRKLKYNLIQAREDGFETLLTFGGAYSNHIAATAAAGQLEGFKTIGVIRGEELGVNLAKTLESNPTLAFAYESGMKFHFISRQEYREKDEVRFRESITKTFNNPFIIPEGGTNELAIKGCEEILTDNDTDFDYICCPIGTAGTISGIINSLKPHQKVLGFPALKGGWVADEVRKYAKNEQWEIIADYHFGGYAKVNGDLVSFINEFHAEHKVLLDPIYTGKMLYGISELMKGGYFRENSRILAVHTGGLQGIAGMNIQLAKKGLPLIH
ncbi:1-aminocyclopropane-1-carboxylate deaminase [Dokdonia sp. Hel_I_63]|uniref:1-aminocyclopropane-1-carboxylate deaminase/D-cysteine desulfhydrase n=1 Tax=Dokdonia sp. Hel_I_63 TaxID=1249996 RepID=UPI00119AAB6D|nr:pyridoxal-phosphate dependent enzyme [Dokdonia sp. Hel_I_63]TVZ21172.1 1-aminocyclopropane-1-carboxylate deaminase [Dokdonia sp. Hel_I_63]